LHSIRKSAVTYAAGGFAPPDDLQVVSQVPRMRLLLQFCQVDTIKNKKDSKMK